MTVKTRHVQLTFTSVKNPSANFVINPVASYLLQRQTYIKFHIEKQVSSEPNRASLEIYGLNNIHASALDFVFDPFARSFGANCVINCGYIEKGVPIAYSGVITSASTVREGKEIITRIELRNNYFELMKRQVTLPVTKTTSKAQAILSILELPNIRANISPQQRAYLNQELGGVFFKEKDIIKGTLDKVLSDFSKGLPRRIVLYWDDAGVNFTPLGKLAQGIPIKEISSLNGMIGVPKITESGLNVDIELSATYKIADPVTIISPTITQLALASTGTAAAERLGITAVSKVIHTGDNRDGEFKTSIETKFIDLLKQVTN